MSRLAVLRLHWIGLALVLFAACSAPATREDLLVVADRNAKLYAQSTLKLNTNDANFRLQSHPDNLKWSEYWAGASVYGDPEVKGWNDQIHTLFAIYALEPGDELAGRETRSFWIFTDRASGEVRGHLAQQRGHAKEFGGSK